jgi:hypothetical protein
MLYNIIKIASILVLFRIVFMFVDLIIMIGSDLKNHGSRDRMVWATVLELYATTRLLSYVDRNQNSLIGSYDTDYDWTILDPTHLLYGFCFSRMVHRGAIFWYSTCISLAKVTLLSFSTASPFTALGGGVIQATASEAVLVVLLAARDRILKKQGKKSLEKLVVYASDQTHSALQKACQVCLYNPTHVSLELFRVTFYNE